MIYWFTGQPGAGKTVLALLLKQHLEESQGLEVFHIDGDDLRELNSNKDYSEQGRRTNIQLAQSIAKYLHSKGKTVVVSLVAPYIDLREEFKSCLGQDIKEIYVYTLDNRGREHYHSSHYTKPIENFISLDTSGKPEKETFKTLLEQL